MTDIISQPAPDSDSNRTIAGSSNKSGGDLIPPDSLRELQSMAMMGELAEAVAHDYNNIVSASLIHLGLLLQDPQLNAGQIESLKTLEQETVRAAGLTRQLLSFGRRRFSSRNDTMDLNHLIQGIEKLLKHLVRENISLSFQPAAEECRIKADVAQVEKLVMSLCLFLRDAMSQGGSLVLKTSVGCMNAAQKGSPEKNSGRMICLTIAARRNAGDSTQNLALDQPSERTQEGWRLDTAHQIAQQLQGWLEMGTDTASPHIRIYLQETRELVRGAGNNGLSEGSLGGTETILLIEDEDFLRRVSAQSLRKLGYAVLDAADSDSAQRLWKKHQAKIDLLLTDLRLPGSESGHDLARMFTAQKPSLQVMLASGNHADLDECSSIDGCRFFPAVKPYSARHLARMVRECLDSPT